MKSPLSFSPAMSHPRVSRDGCPAPGMLTAMASVTEASSTLPKWPQNMELTRWIRKISSWIKI